MTPYVKNVWVDESLAGPTRFDILENAGGAYKSSMQINLSTPVTVAGTTMDAEKMNNIEQGIETLDTLLSNIRDAAALLTIASGAITITQSNHKLQPETGTGDDLVTINGTTAGQSGFFYAEDYGTDTITLKHGTGNILCMGGADISLSHGCVSWLSIGTHVLISGGGSGGGGSFTYPSSALSAVARDDQIRIIKDVSAVTDYYIELQNLLQFGSFASSYTFSSGGGNYNLTDALPYYVDVLPFANGDVNLPAKSAANHAYAIRNESGTYTLTVKLSGGTTIGTIAPGEMKIILPSASYNFKIATTGIPTSYLDTDGTLAANSDTKLATQKATKTYVDTAVTGLLDFKGSTDASTNPNYPSALKGDAYIVSVAGKVGGASGKSVDIGDVYLATADNAGGTEASVGTSWSVLEHNLAGALLSANNLSDVGNAATARGNLGAIGAADTATLTNKRVQPRPYTIASTATLTPEKDTYDLFTLTAQAVNLTIANHSTTTMADGEGIRIRVLDNGTPRTITHGTNYVAKGGIVLPTTTTANKWMEMGYEWNSAISKYVLNAFAQET